MIDIGRELRNAMSTGKITIGTREVERALNKGKVKLLIVADNTNEDIERVLEAYESTPRYQFSGVNVELGSLCGKPFPVAVVGIQDPGESQIMKLMEK